MSAVDRPSRAVRPARSRPPGASPGARKPGPERRRPCTNAGTRHVSGAKGTRSGDPSRADFVPLIFACSTGGEGEGDQAAGPRCASPWLGVTAEHDARSDAAAATSAPVMRSNARGIARSGFQIRMEAGRTFAGNEEATGGCARPRAGRQVWGGEKKKAAARVGAAFIQGARAGREARRRARRRSRFARRKAVSGKARLFGIRQARRRGVGACRDQQGHERDQEREPPAGTVRGTHRITSE